MLVMSEALYRVLDVELKSGTVIARDVPSASESAPAPPPPAPPAQETIAKANNMLTRRAKTLKISLPPPYFLKYFLTTP